MGPRLLVVEDEPATLAILSLVLELSGYSVVRAHSAEVALDALVKGGFDLVLTDLLLDRASVATAWARLDKIVELAHPAPVGLITGWMDGFREHADHGVAFALLKPVTRDSLLAQLAKTLEIAPLDDRSSATLHAYFRCLEERSYEALSAICARDVVYRLPGTEPRFANEVRGLDEFVAFTRRTFEVFAEPRFGVHAIRPLPQGAIVEYTGSWLEGDTRRSMPGAVMFELDGRLIKRIDVRVDADQIA